MSLTTNNIKISINSVKELPDNRKRIPLPNSVVNKIKSDINSMPKSNLKKRKQKIIIGVEYLIILIYQL